MNSIINPAIVVVGYNRVEGLARLLKSVENAVYDVEDVTLIISLDHGGNPQVEALARQFVWTQGPKFVRTFEQNQGLKKHILDCCNYSLEYGATVILEDDLVVSPMFYRYVLQALDFYHVDERVFGIALYSQKWNGYSNRSFEPMTDGSDAYLSKVACSWGQCIIGKQWESFLAWYSERDHNLDYSVEMPEVVSSWKNSQGKYIAYYLASADKYFVTPYVSLSSNFHESGTHVNAANSTYQVPMQYAMHKYRFAGFNQAIKYDNFFESDILRVHFADKYPNKKVCIDFYGLHHDRERYDYCISSAVLPYECVQSWGLRLRPFEWNILYDVAGTDIFMYDLSHKKDKVKETKLHHYNWMKYELRDIGWLDALFYALYERLFLK